MLFTLETEQLTLAKQTHKITFITGCG